MMPQTTLLPLVTAWAVVFVSMSPGAVWSEPANSKSQQQGDDAALIAGRTDKPDGITALTIGRRLPARWDAKIGVDVDLDGSWTTPTVESRLDGTWQQDRSSGAGWASVTLPVTPLGWDKATLEARVDPAQDQGTLAATLTRSVPLGSATRLNLESGYAVTEPLPSHAASENPAGSPGAPLSTSAATENTISLDIQPMATTFSAGAKLSIAEQRWLRSFGTEKKLFGGPLSITGTVNERTDGDIDGRFTAGFKHKW